jgi:hypothetical protein
MLFPSQAGGCTVLGGGGAGIRRTQCESQDPDDDLEADEDERPYYGDIFCSCARGQTCEGHSQMDVGAMSLHGEAPEKRDGHCCRRDWGEVQALCCAVQSRWWDDRSTSGIGRVFLSLKARHDATARGRRGRREHGPSGWECLGQNRPSLILVTCKIYLPMYLSTTQAHSSSCRCIIGMVSDP